MQRIGREAQRIPPARWSLLAQAYFMFAAMYLLMRCTSGAGSGT